MKKVSLELKDITLNLIPLSSMWMLHIKPEFGRWKGQVGNLWEQLTYHLPIEDTSLTGFTTFCVDLTKSLFLKGQFFCTNSVFGFLAVYSNLEVCFSYGHIHCFIIESNIVLVLFWICGVTSVKELHPGTQIKIRPKSYLHPVLYLAMCKYFESHGKWTDWKNMDIPNVDIIAVNFFIALVFGVLYTV